MGCAFLFWLFISGLRNLGIAFIAFIKAILALIDYFGDNKE